MTKREKIIRFLSDNGLDILSHERKDSKYAKSGTIVINGYYSADKDFLYAVDALTGYDPKTGKVRPIAIKIPYHKDIWGNIDWFERDWSEVRVVWVGD